jgi:hypothetical protein
MHDAIQAKLEPCRTLLTYLRIAISASHWTFLHWAGTTARILSSGRSPDPSMDHRGLFGWRPVQTKGLLSRSLQNARHSVFLGRPPLWQLERLPQVGWSS